ncbi:MAG: sulfite exporter TauE/SafE family protein [Clostridia bacterium]|nr:sulfite exporter TauE/SafE family protein [Clostridia bacterium]
MYYILLGLTGIVGGILGGMGMGGGTLLIPMLTIFFSIEQHTAQAINLISFIPMAVVALIIHLKNKLIDFNKILLIIVPGIITCVLGCLLARAISGDLLKRIFGGFLLLLSVYQFYCIIKKK